MIMLTSPAINAARRPSHCERKGPFWIPIKRWLAVAVLVVSVVWAPQARAQGGLAFQPYWTFRTEAPVADVATGDVDGDGTPEVIAATTDGLVYVLGNDGDLHWRYEAGFVLTNLMVGDLFGDGGAAEIAAQGEGELVLTESERPARSFYSGSNAVWRFVAADVDGDGRPEAITSRRDGYIFVVNPRSGVTLDYRSLGRPLAGVWVGEIDGDGRPELVPTLTGGRDLVVLEDDLLTAWTRQLPDEVGPVQGGDVDGDGRAEVVVLSAAWKLYMLESDGASGWHTQSLWVSEDSVAPTPEQLLIRDLDGDGRAEIVVAAPGPPATVHVFDGRGERVWQHTLEAVSTPTRLAAGDVDGDGTTELIVTSDGQGQVYLLNAAGERIAEYATEKTTGALTTADLNGDGRGEIIVGTETGVQVFGASHQLAWGELWRSRRLTGAVTALNLTDVNGDGRDEVAAGVDNGRYYLLSQTGKVLWEADLEELVRALSAGDVDGDGQPEVVAATMDVTHIGKGQLHLLDGDQRRWTVPAEGYINSLAVQDVDGDGRAEIIAGSEARSRGMVQVLDGAGAVAWQREFDQPVTAVRGDAGQVLAGTRSGRVYRMAPDGRPIGEYTLGAEVIGFGGDLAATADGRVYRLEQNGPSLVRGELGQATKWVQVGRDWIAVLEGEQVSLLAGAGPLRQGRVAGKGLSLAAGDLNGDGELELAVGSDQGRISLFGLGLDQPPMLTGPDLAETRSGYAYSVEINDPEGDTVAATLEIWDPSAGSWMVQPAQYLDEGLGQARLTWEVPQPFDTWDSGRESRFRFGYDDGHVKGALGGIPGPLSVPTTPWHGYYGQRVGLGVLILMVPALGLLFYRRQRAYRRSPVGQAEALLGELSANPDEALVKLHNLARDDPAQLTLVSGLASEAGQATLADLSEGFHLVLTRPEVADQGVGAILGAIESLDGSRGRRAETIVNLYDLFRRLLEANTVSRVIALRSELDDAREDKADPDLTPNQLAPALSGLEQVAQSLRNYQRVDLVEDKVAYLAQAMESLGRLERELQAMVPQPEGNILARIATNWLAVSTNALRDLQGQAQIEASLKTRHLLALDQAIITLELSNSGRSPASNVTVTLLPGQGYEVRDGAALLDILPAGRSALVELPLSADPSTDQFRTEFSITFDDRERSGKSLAFADRVQLLRPAAEFQPIPNPYAPGTPLSSGSPLFFGREDLFQFIAENMAGLARQNILVLIGQRRMGKTSFLRQLPARLDGNYLPVYVDGQSLGVDPGMSNFFYDLALAITDALAEQGIDMAEPELEDFQERPSGTFERSFLPVVFEAIGSRQLLLLFDEFEELEVRVASGKLEPSIFSYFRHLMQHGGDLGFIFVGTHRLEALSADYWSIFFNIALYKHVTFLSEAAARALIMEPVVGSSLLYDDLAVDKMLRVTAGHPYFLQLICHALVNHANRERRGYLTIQDVNNVLGGMVELGEAHFAFLWEQSSPPERLVLASLSWALGREPTSTSIQISELLAGRGVVMEVQDVTQALGRLVERDILRELRGQPPRYEFKVALVRLWVERYKALGQVIEEVT
jgi:outer membrane protein assembly factor BamB